MRRGAATIIAASGAAIAAISIASLVKFAPLLVWNASASAPIGLYQIERNKRLEVGDFVLVRSHEALTKFIAERGYLPENIPLLKRVAALPGHEICRESEAIMINEIRVADAQIFDSFGRKLPAWSGCFTLQSSEIFLLNDPENSLDGRYFGATKAKDVVGVAKPLWIRENDR
ncbi:MAG TPA: S26 family signal peptidase [Parvularcula sp.]|jgi:conjugative transfer signal peptidase TraF|nr:S26 family signal peptidase [Parvularcula sp.]